MKRIILIVPLLLCGCEPIKPQTIITSTGTNQVVVTNGAIYLHSWSHTDTYDFVSNAIPQ